MRAGNKELSNINSGGMMGQFNLNSGEILSSNIQMVNEQGGHTVIHLEITTDLATTKFRISSDSTHPDINRISQELRQGLQASQRPAGAFGINELPERAYIYVTYPNGNSEKYTGSRL